MRNYHNILFTTLLLLFFTYTTSAQISMSGTVQTIVDEKITSASFVPIVILEPRDTLNAFRGAITDVNGDYILNNIPAGDYIVKIQSLSYKTFQENIVIPLPSDSQSYFKDFMLEEQSHMLNEVAVTTNATKQSLDNKSYVILKKDLINAVSGVDLLTKIPELSFDPVLQKISASRGGSIKILINGANATEQDVMALNPDQIKNIEHYDLPPAKYSGYSNVVNFVTKKINSGFYGGIRLQHAFTTGFGNDNIFLKYNFGDNQLTLNGARYYRDYKDVNAEESYDYMVDGKHYVRNEFQKGEFGYDDNYIDLTYTRNVKDKYLLQVNFSPDFQNRHSSANLSIDQKIDDELKQRVGVRIDNSKYFTPSLDMYASVILPKKQELMFNIVGTLSNAEQQSSRKEYLLVDNELALSDKNDLDNRKRSIIGEVNYTKSFGQTMLSIGNKFDYGRLDSHAEKLTDDSDFRTDVLTNYSYVEFSGNTKTWMYRATSGLFYNKKKNDIQSVESFTFRPMVVVGYRISDLFSIRGAYNRDIKQPSLSELSNNKIMVTDGIVKEGNPLLKNSVSDIGRVDFNANYKWLNVSIYGRYERVKNSINSYFIEGENSISLKYENAESSKSADFGYSIAVSPFEDKLLTFKVNGGVSFTAINSPIVGEYSHISYPFSYEIASNYKNFRLSYMGNIITYRNDGPYLRSNEKTSNLTLQYRYKKMSALASCFWLLSKAEYSSETIGESIVSYSRINEIVDNRSMFTLGVSYRFNTGKKYNEKSKRLNNSDRDTGLF